MNGATYMLYSESKDKAKILVEQFHPVFTKLGTRTLAKLPKCFKFDMPLLVITAPGIEKLLKKINVSTSIGPDNISNVILNKFASQLAPGPSAIFQKSIGCGDLQEDRVNANILSVFKKGGCVSS